MYAQCSTDHNALRMEYNIESHVQFKIVQVNEKSFDLKEGI